VVIDDTTDGVWAPARRTMTVGLVMTVTLVASEALAVATVLPRIANELDGHTLYGWVFSAFILGSLVGTVIAGQRADRDGPGPPFLLGAALFAVGLVIGGTAQHMSVLVVGRAIQGLGAGAIPAVAYVVIGRDYPDAVRPKMFAIMSTAWVVPGLAGPAVAGLVADAFGWRWVFLGLLPLVAVSTALTLRAVGHIGPPARTSTAVAVPKGRMRAALLLAGGTALFLAGTTSHRLIVAVALASVGMLIAVPPLRRLMPSGTLTARPGLPSAIAVRGLNNAIFFGTDAFVPLALTRVRHQSTLFGGAALTAATLTWTAGAWVQARFVGRVGPRRLIRLGLGFIVVGVLLTMATLSSALPAAAGIVAWGIAGLGMGLAYAPISLIVLREAPAGEEGRASASMSLADNLGVALGTGLGGAAIAYGEIAHWAPKSGIAVAFLIALSAGAVGALATRGLPDAPHAVEEASHVGS
jgi:MFS family permease